MRFLGSSTVRKCRSSAAPPLSAFSPASRTPRPVFGSARIFWISARSRCSCPSASVPPVLPVPLGAASGAESAAVSGPETPVGRGASAAEAEEGNRTAGARTAAATTVDTRGSFMQGNLSFPVKGS